MPARTVCRTELRARVHFWIFVFSWIPPVEDICRSGYLAGWANESVSGGPNLPTHYQFHDRCLTALSAAVRTRGLATSSDLHLSTRQKACGGKPENNKSSV